MTADTTHGNDLTKQRSRRGSRLRNCLLAGTMLLAACPILPVEAQQSQPAGGKKPNIVVIMADDVGIWNISAYHRGMMGGNTPNIDRIAR